MNSTEALTAFVAKFLLPAKARRLTALTTAKKGRSKILEALCHAVEPAIRGSAVGGRDYSGLWGRPCYAFHRSVGYGAEFATVREGHEELSADDGWLIVLKDASAGILRPEGPWDNEIRIGGYPNTMKSNKQRRAELDAKRKARAAKLPLAAGQKRGAPVNTDALAPDGSYDRPDFVKREFYVDQPFECVDCGKPEVWTAKQQKWWYEVAKGNVWTTARRCRVCRRRERERKADARRVHFGGLNRKRTGKQDRTRQR